MSSETCVVEDCTYYNSAEVTRSSTNGSTIYDNDMSVALPTNCEISYDMSASNVSSGSERRVFILPKSQFSTGTSQPSYALFSQFRSSQLEIGVRRNSTNSNVEIVLRGVTSDNYYNVRYVRNGTSVDRYVEDTLIDTITVDFLDNYTDWTFSMIRWSASGTSKMKNVKIKPIISV